MRPSFKRILIICLLTVSSAREGQAKTVNVAVPSYSMSLIAFAIAKEQGYYGQEGLDVNFILMTAPLASRALIGGNVEFATVGGSALTGILAGASLRLLFSSFNRAVFWLYAKSEIRDVKQLKGKRLGVSAIGAGPDSMLRDLLKTHGVDSEKDVIILATGVDSNRYAALTSGAVDAVLLSTPYNFVAEEAGFREIVSFIKHDWVELQGCIVTREAFLRENPALVQSFTPATLKGLEYVRNVRSGTIPAIARMMKVKPELAGKIYDLTRPAMTSDGILSVELQRKALEHLTKRMDLKEPPRLERIYDFSIAQKARVELSARGWKP
jgi:ABC-type nitrate/sulfonate/bicarbonate transport system substrate-binding protein